MPNSPIPAAIADTRIHETFQKELPMTTSPDDTKDAGITKQIAAWWDRYIVYDPHLNQPKAPLSKYERTMRVGFAIYCVGMAVAAVAAFGLFLIAVRGV